jgi:hypothetical protein
MAVDTNLFIDGEYLGQIHLKAMLGFFGLGGELDRFATGGSGSVL